MKAAIVAEQPAKMLVGVDHSHLLLAIERKKEDWVRLMLGSLPPGGKLERFGYGA